MGLTQLWQLYITEFSSKTPTNCYFSHVIDNTNELCVCVFVSVYVYFSVCVCVCFCEWLMCWDIPPPKILCRPPQFSPHPPTHIHTHALPIFTPAYLSSVPHTDEGAHGLEGTGSTGQEVGAVVGLQEANKVGTFRLQNTVTYTEIKTLYLKEICKKVSIVSNVLRGPFEHKVHSDYQGELPVSLLYFVSALSSQFGSWPDR